MKENMTVGKILREITDLKISLNELQNRATGRTTRLVDDYIQELFNRPNEWINVYDHYPEKRASAMLVDKIRKRLKNEHNLEANVRSIEGGFSMMLKNYKKPDFSNEINRIKESIEELSKIYPKMFL